MSVDYRDVIKIEPGKRGGKPCIRGMRIPVSVIVKQIAHGASRQEVLADYPELQDADIQEALDAIVTTRKRRRG